MKQALDEAGKRIVERMKDTFVTKGLNDTGEAMDSLSYKVEGNKILIEGLGRVLFLEYGRSAGTFPNVDAIRSWVGSKLGITDEKERDSVAFLIGRKIKEKGTDILTNEAKGLQIELTLSEITKQMHEEISHGYALNATTDLFKELNKKL